jgi:glutamyl-tRNA reductase
VEREFEAYLAWARVRDAVPAVVALREHAEAVRRAELESARGRLEALTAAQAATVDALTRALVNKLLHAPTVGLKELARTGGEEELAAARALLGLAPSPTT